MHAGNDSAISLDVTNPNFLWHVIGCASMCIHCYSKGMEIVTLRRKFNVEYPDMGDGRFSKRLKRKEWIELKNAINLHYFYCEQLNYAIFACLLGGLLFPHNTSNLVFFYMFSFEVYNVGMKRKNPRLMSLGRYMSKVFLFLMITVFVLGFIYSFYL